MCTTWTKVNKIRLEISLFDCRSLSHHAGAVLPAPLDHLLVVVGGWDGRRRTSDVRLYSLKDQKWIKLKETPPSMDDSRYNAPVGLSNHTVDVINTKLLAVVGRQGGTMTQRRFGELILVHIDVKKTFTYHYEQTLVQPPSRSGTWFF